MSYLRPYMFVCSVALSLLACGGDGDGGSISIPSVAELSTTCQSVVGKTFAGMTVKAATRYEAVPGVSSSGFCKVSATRAPYLDLEVVLPDNWSGRLFQIGGGGFDGAITSALTIDGGGALTALSPAIARYAAVYVSTNGGNRANVPSEAAPSVWANGTPAATASAEDYAYKSLEAARLLGTALSQEFYGTAPRRTYFAGCSNGGRQAYEIASLWPDNYDGISAGCAPIDIPGQTAQWLSVDQAYTAAPVTTSQYDAAYAAALNACDANDGLRDGVIANPASCTLAAETLQCAGTSTDSVTCLSSAQVRTLNSVLKDNKLSDGTLVYSGSYWGNFGSFAGFHGAVGGAYAYLATHSNVWLTAGAATYYNIDRDYLVFKAQLPPLKMDADISAVARYVSSGHKLLVWHAGSDNLISMPNAYRTHSMMKAIAVSQGLADPRVNTRFFMVPGAAHGQGQALNEVDWLGALIDWVENGNSPSQLVYRFKSESGGTRTMPVCESPTYPKYTGSGDLKLATSYTCTAP